MHSHIPNDKHLSPVAVRIQELHPIKARVIQKKKIFIHRFIDCIYGVDLRLRDIQFFTLQ